MDIAQYPRGGEIFVRITQAGKESSDEPNFVYPVGHVPRSSLLSVGAEEVEKVILDKNLSPEDRRELVAAILYLVYRRAYGTGQMHLTNYSNRFARPEKQKTSRKKK